MRAVFFLLVLVNLVLFVWSQGYFGGQQEGREPQRLREQIDPEKMRVAPQAAAPAAAQACRRVEGLAAGEAEQLRQALQDGGLTASIQAAEEAPGFWVNIPALPSKAVADKKAGELKLFGITDFHVIQAEGGSFAISLGLFKNEDGANEFLQGLNRKGVKSARIETRAMPPAPVRLEVRGAAELLARRLPELLTATNGATAGDCP